MATRWDEHFFASTRGRILRLIRSAPRTVGELAKELGVTDNAVRAQLLALERDGLVEQQGQRRGLAKPSSLYGLTPDGENFFPKAYGSVLGQLLDVLSESLPGQTALEALRETGRRLATEGSRAPSSPAEALAAAAARVEALGGLVDLESMGPAVFIRGRSCPLAGVAASHPEACELVAALVAETSGGSVRELCDRAARPPQCRFEVVIDD
jgi:predicted ArsR family transcriptional regulator